MYTHADDKGPTATYLIEKNIPLAQQHASRAFRTLHNFYDYGELLSITYLALTQSANNWSAYCARNNFDPNAYNEYFGAYASRRMSGAIKDHQRLDDPLSRVERKRNKEGDNLPANLQLPVSLDRMKEAAEEGGYFGYDPPSQELTPEEILAWKEIATLALKAFDSLPEDYQIALAIATLKPDTVKLPTDIQTRAWTAREQVVYGALSHLTPMRDPQPLMSPQLHNPLEPFLELLSQSPGTSATPEELILEFKYTLVSTPTVLVRLTRSSRKKWTATPSTEGLKADI